MGVGGVNQNKGILWCACVRARVCLCMRVAPGRSRFLNEAFK